MLSSNLFLLACLSIAVSSVLQPRMAAPAFSAPAVLPDKSFTTIDLEDFAGKYLVAVFYPFDFTYVCPTELLSYSDRVKEFQELGAEVIAISVDSQFSHLAWMKTPRSAGGVENLAIPLLSDISKDISRAYGVLVTNKDDDLFGASLRGLFIIDGKGIIRSITINDAPVGRSVDETLRTLKAFLYTDKNGVVCPANWQPGSKTIIPDQEKKVEYFKEL